MAAVPSPLRPRPAPSAADSCSRSCGRQLHGRRRASRSATCSAVRALAIGAATVRCAASHARATAVTRDAAVGGDVVEHREQVDVPRVVEVAAARARAGRLGRRARAVLAGQEAARERRVRDLDDPELLRAVGTRSISMPRSTRLHLSCATVNGVRPSAAAIAAAAREPRRRRSSRRRSRAPCPRVTSAVERGERLLLRHVGSSRVREVEVDAVGPQPAQRVLDRGLDVRGGQALPSSGGWRPSSRSRRRPAGRGLAATRR